MTFKLDPAYGGSPQTVMIAGKFAPQSAAVSFDNVQVLSTSLNQTTPGVSNLTPATTLAPASQKLAIFANPCSTKAPYSTNMSGLPRGLVSTSPSLNGSEFVLDLNGFPGEIIAADAALVPAARTARVLEAVVQSIDQSNMLVYINVVNYSTGALAAINVGMSIAYKVFIKDTIGV